MTLDNKAHIIYLASGTNLGDRLANLNTAAAALSPPVKVLQASPVYQTAPWGYLEQPDFLNQALKAETRLTPHNLLQFLKNLETRLGRQPGIRYGPRLIDLDILFYDDLVMDTEELTIPHPRLAERAFVLVPLAAIAPNVSHPILHLTIRQMLQEVDVSGVHQYRDQQYDT
jgi:2-amino-4-hydroxy-6-hydroxymethyldihydropteridine diphosphokinase